MLQSIAFPPVNIRESPECGVPILPAFSKGTLYLQIRTVELLTLHQCTHSLQLLQKQMPLFNTWAILTKSDESDP